MRPATLDEFVGQEHFLGPGKLLRRLIAADRLGSLIFHGPPGCGKTTLAPIIAKQTRRRFRPLNAVAAGLKEVREVAAEARAELEAGGPQTILFVDEIHRFSRSQQDVLLPEVEEGRLTLIGTTTHNSFFAVNSPLLSLSSIFSFAPLDRAAIRTLILRALADTERGLGRGSRRDRRGRAGVSRPSERRRRSAGADGTGGRLVIDGRATRPVHPRAGGGIDPAEGPGVRRHRGRAL
jgi:putative ATPase